MIFGCRSQFRSSVRLLAAVLLFSCSVPAADPLPVFSRVDLNRYIGKWHEIARLPMFFQRNCVSDITAEYSLKPDGKIQVLNQCREKDGKLSKATGTARVVDPSTNAKLKVSFFWPFSGDYWILDLGPDYEYAMVGEPSRKYLWILSRQPDLDEGIYRKLVEKAKLLGFDTSRLIRATIASHGM
jgi:apolipoprotein D and lipocalin family protein